MQQRSRRKHALKNLATSERKSSVRPLLAALGPVVYAIRTRDNLVKIGFTSNLAHRYAQIGSMANILGWKSGTLNDESAIHRHLAPHAVRGREYYAPHPDVLAVVNEMREALGLEDVASL